MPPPMEHTPDKLTGPLPVQSYERYETMPPPMDHSPDKLSGPRPVHAYERYAPAPSLIVQELLAEQLSMAERVLEVNCLISQHLARERGRGTQQPPMAQPVRVNPNSLPREAARKRQSLPTVLNVPEAADAMSDLKRPLLHVEVHESHSGMVDLASRGIDQLVLKKEEDFVAEVCKDNPTSSLMHEDARSPVPTRRTSSLATKSPRKNVAERMFPRIGDMSEAVSDIVNQRSIVEDLYRHEGICQAIARHHIFETMSLVVIVFNTIWIAVDTDHNHADILCEAAAVFQIADNLFCTFFTFELTVRFLAFKDRPRAFRDPWFMFDATLVLLMVWETWGQVLIYLWAGMKWGGGGRSATILRIFRIFRIMRVARTAKLLHAMPELMILVKGMTIAMRSVFAILCLLTLCIYIFAVVFAQLLGGTAVGSGKFDSVPGAMNTLMVQVLCGFDADFMNEMLSAGIVYYILFVAYCLLGSLTIMNMLIGILCEVVGAVADAEKEARMRNQVEVRVNELALMLDTNGDEHISKEEFEELLIDPDLTQKLQDCGVDVMGVADFASFVFREVKEISFPDFRHMIGQFRPCKEVTVKDLMESRKHFALELSFLEGRLVECFKGASTVHDA